MARLLPTYQKRVEAAIIALNETEARLNFARGQANVKMRAATVRRDDARRRHELMVRAINSNAARERSVAKEITRARAEIGSNEQDLSATQQMESQTKLRVETIEHKMSMERALHMDAAANLKEKSRGVDKANVKTAGGIEEKKAMMEARKAELSKMCE